MIPEALNSILMIFFVVFFILLGGHIGVVLAMTGVAFAVLNGRIELVSFIPDRFYGTMTSFSLIAVPLFVFMGIILEKAKIAEKTFAALHVLMGKLPGSLLLATTIFSIMFGACTGVLGAIIVSMGLIALPTMMAAGYNKEISCGTVCAGSSLGLVIPPSIMLVIYGPTAGVSIAELFFACFIPGVLIGIVFLIYIFIRCYLNPKLAPPALKKEEIMIKGNRVKLFISSVFPTIALIVAVLGSILAGVASPTEAAAVGSVGALLISIMYGQLTWKNLFDCCWETTKITAFIMFIILGANIFTTMFMGLGGSDVLSDIVLKIQTHVGTSGTIFLIMLIIFILGMFMDWIGILMIFVPITVPIINTLGINALWFGTIFCMVLTISCITPPFAYTAFYLRGIVPENSGITLGHIYRGLIPFIFLEIIVVILVYIFPELSNWLPEMML